MAIASRDGGKRCSRSCDNRAVGGLGFRATRATPHIAAGLARHSRAGPSRDAARPRAQSRAPRAHRGPESQNGRSRAGNGSALFLRAPVVGARKRRPGRDARVSSGEDRAWASGGRRPPPDATTPPRRNPQREGRSRRLYPVTRAVPPRRSERRPRPRAVPSANESRGGSLTTVRWHLDLILRYHGLMWAIIEVLLLLYGLLLLFRHSKREQQSFITVPPTI